MFMFVWHLGRTLGHWCLVAMPLAFVGCTAIGQRSPAIEREPAERQESLTHLVDQYETRRDQATRQAARSRLQAGDEAGAIRMLADLVERSPNDRQARLLLADLYLVAGDREQAHQHLRYVLERDQNDAPALHAMAMLLEANGHTDKAIVLHRRAAEIEPDNQLFQLSWQASRNASDRRPLDDQREDADQGSVHSSDFQYLVACTDNPQAQEFMRLAAAAFRTGVIPVAVGELEHAMQADPQNPQIPVNLAQYALRLNQNAVAAVMLDAATRKFPTTATVHRAYGLALYRMGDYTSAETALRKAVSLDNGDALAYFLMGYSLERQGKHAESVASFDQAQTLDATLSSQR